MKKRGMSYGLEKNKKGQFYLLSAIIIVAIIISFAAVSNYSLKKDNAPFNSLSSNLNAEGEKVLDYEQINGITDYSAFDDFAQKYSEYAGSDTKIHFIIGDGENPSGFDAFRYLGSTKIDESSNLSVGSNIVFGLEGINYKFNLLQGKNFYYIMTQESGGEKNVLTN